MSVDQLRGSRLRGYGSHAVSRWGGSTNESRHVRSVRPERRHSQRRTHGAGLRMEGIGRRRIHHRCGVGTMELWVDGVGRRLHLHGIHTCNDDLGITRGTGAVPLHWRVLFLHHGCRHTNRRRHGRERRLGHPRQMLLIQHSFQSRGGQTEGGLRHVHFSALLVSSVVGGPETKINSQPPSDRTMNRGRQNIPSYHC